MNVQKSMFAKANKNEQYEMVSSVAFPAYSTYNTNALQFSEDVMLPVVDGTSGGTTCLTYLMSGVFSVARKLPGRDETKYTHVWPQLVATSGEGADTMYTYNIVPVPRKDDLLNMSQSAEGDFEY